VATELPKASPRVASPPICYMQLFLRRWIAVKVANVGATSGVLPTNANEAAITCNQMFQFSIGFLNKREQAYERLKGQQAKQFIHTKAWLATISLALCKAFDLLDMLKKEEEMLLAVKERKAKDGNAFAREMLDERTKKAEAWHHNAATCGIFQTS